MKLTAPEFDIIWTRIRSSSGLSLFGVNVAAITGRMDSMLLPMDWSIDSMRVQKTTMIREVGKSWW